MPKRKSKKPQQPKRNVPEPVREATQREAPQSDPQADDEAPFFPPEPEPTRGGRGAQHSHGTRREKRRR